MIQPLYSWIACLELRHHWSPAPSSHATGRELRCGVQYVQYCTEPSVRNLKTAVSYPHHQLHHLVSHPSFSLITQSITSTSFDPPTLLHKLPRPRLFPHHPTNQPTSRNPTTEIANFLRTMFNSVTRIFRRRSFFFPTSATTTTAAAAAAAADPPRKRSRHELVSEAHIAYMEAHQQRQQQAQQQQRQRSGRRQASLPSSTPTPTSTTRSSRRRRCSGGGGGEDVLLSLSPFESLCLELRAVEESVCRYVGAPSGCARDPIYFC